VGVARFGTLVATARPPHPPSPTRGRENSRCDWDTDRPAGAGVRDAGVPEAASAMRPPRGPLGPLADHVVLKRDVFSLLDMERGTSGRRRHMPGVLAAAR